MAFRVTCVRWKFGRVITNPTSVHACGTDVFKKPMTPASAPGRLGCSEDLVLSRTANRTRVGSLRICNSYHSRKCESVGKGPKGKYRNRSARGCDASKKPLACWDGYMIVRDGTRWVLGTEGGVTRNYEGRELDPRGVQLFHGETKVDLVRI